jgi:hypothetical protein
LGNSHKPGNRDGLNSLAAGDRAPLALELEPASMGTYPKSGPAMASSSGEFGGS